MFVRNTILTSPEGGMATPLGVTQTHDGPRPERVALLSGDYCLKTRCRERRFTSFRPFCGRSGLPISRAGRIFR